MKNTINDLNDYLFEQLERLNDDSLADKQFDKEIKKAKAITSISDQICKNATLMLHAKEISLEYGLEKDIIPLGMGDKNGIPK